MTRELEEFIHNKEQKRPSFDPGYGKLQATTLEQLINSPAAAQYLLPCLHNGLASMLHRIIEANNIKVQVDSALVEYTATYPGSLSDSYIAAARLHGRIEQLLYIYKNFLIYPEILNYIMDEQSCDEEINIK